MGTVFLDLKKAFDTVNHRVLLYKLQHFQLSANTIHWFESYLTGRQQCVKVNGVKSHLLPNNMGVPQGSVLGPLLFTMYINDLPKICPSVYCQMYADDTAIYVGAKTATLAAAHLTSALVHISKWLELSHLTLNVSKTVAMCISLRKRPISDPFKVLISNQTIIETHEVKYLGIILDNHLKFDRQVKHICKKVQPSLNCFRHIRKDLSCKTAQLYMHAMIFSHLSYSITSWSQSSQSILKPISSIYKQAIKIMDQKPMRWHHCSVLIKHNLFSFENFISYCNINLVFKCLNKLTAPLFSALVSRRQNTRRTTRASSNGDCIVPTCRTTFGQTAFSIKGPNLWNSIPTELKLETDSNVFKRGLKSWLKSNQRCTHEQ